MMPLALSIGFATVTAGIKFYYDSKLANQQFQAQLIKDSLESDDEQERLESLEFLIDIHLITDKKIQKALKKYMDNQTNDNAQSVNKLPQYAKQVFNSVEQQNHPTHIKNQIHLVVGTWGYRRGKQTYYRTFTQDNKCQLSCAKYGLIWEYPYKVMNEREVMVSEQTVLVHDLIDEDELLLPHMIGDESETSLEARYIAKRTSKPLDNAHAIIGTWEYTVDGQTYTRTFTQNKQCIDHERKYPYEIKKNGQVVVIASQLFLYHKVYPNGQLNIENRYTATRVTLEDDSKIHEEKK